MIGYLAHKLSSAFGVGVVLGTLGCTTPSLIPSDISMAAVDANDKTLVMSACETAPSRGLDICRYVEGSKIESKWTIIMPWEHSTTGTVRIRYRDTVKIYDVSGPVLDIYWSDIVGSQTWTPAQDGLVQALGTVQFTDWNGAVVTTKVLGYAYLVILKPGYTPLNIDSNNVQAMKTTRCELIYTEKGRSQIHCLNF